MPDQRGEEIEICLDEGLEPTYYFSILSLVDFPDKFWKGCLRDSGRLTFRTQDLTLSSIITANLSQ